MTTKPFRLDRVQIIEATAGAILAAAIVSTFGGVTWLVFKLPVQLTSLQDRLEQLIENVTELDDDLGKLKTRVDDHERRIYKLER